MNFMINYYSWCEFSPKIMHLQLPNNCTLFLGIAKPNFDIDTEIFKNHLKLKSQDCHESPSLNQIRVSLKNTPVSHTRWRFFSHRGLPGENQKFPISQGIIFSANNRYDIM